VGMTRLFVPKNAIVSIEQMDEDFKLEDSYGKYQGLASDYICTREEDKGKFILAEDHIKDNYVEIQKVEVKQTTKQLSPFEEQFYTNAYAEMKKLNNDESELYIKKKIDLISNKAF
jgi:hypothetical protein